MPRLKIVIQIEINNSRIGTIDCKLLNKILMCCFPKKIQINPENVPQEENEIFMPFSVDGLILNV